MAEHVRRLTSDNAELERLLEERTLDLGRVNDDLQTVSESVAHDLRNPLNTVSLNVHLLRIALKDGDRDLGEMAIEHLESAQHQMTDVLDRLRSFSRASYHELHREPVDMAELALEVFENLERQEPPPPVELRLAELPSCEADVEMVRALLLNLLGNALKYSRDRQDRWVEVGFESGTQPTVYYVRDNGAGFDPAGEPDLFEPFRRRSTDGAGRAVGLAVAARVAQRHGGDLWATSRPGAGATFRFRLAPERAR